MNVKAKNKPGGVGKLKELLAHQEMVVVLVIILLAIYLSIVRPDSFPTTMNIFNVLRQASPVSYTHLVQDVRGIKTAGL